MDSGNRLIRYTSGMDLRYCSDCRVAMGYRIEPSPEGWTQVWVCFVCGKRIEKFQKRYNRPGKETPPAETATEAEPKAQVAPVKPEKAPKTPPEPVADEQTAEQSQAQERAAESAETASADVPARRRRGRPPKQEPQDAAQDSANSLLSASGTSDVNESSQAAVDPPHKRGRGRPPKAKPDEEQQTMDFGLQPASEEAPVKRGRGRPRKNA